MTPNEFRERRERYGLTQSEIAKCFGVTRNTVQNWENAITALPSTIDQAFLVWEDRFKKETAERGPVALCYADGPMWIDVYRPRSRTPFLHQEPYPTNSAALARVKMIWGNDNVHGPFIMEQSGDLLWNQMELAGVVNGSDKGAPTVRNTLAKLANYILENSAVFVRDERMPTAEEIQAKTAEIRAIGEALLRLAGESETRGVSYEAEFEPLLKQLHALGSYPTNRQVGDVAFAIQGEEVIGRWAT
ncbi:helix-turn-helix domain-containing protein [Bradyrhizobium sp.]|uniref:helix-turn-helix domain-containing protein n=1 Tax=Bradyrhizobium sp. TaxID=376 RepID=UPI003C442A5A